MKSIILILVLSVSLSCQSNNTNDINMKISSVANDDIPTLDSERSKFIQFCSGKSKNKSEKDYCACAFNRFLELGIYNKAGLKLVSEEQFFKFLETKEAKNVHLQCDSKHRKS